MEEIKDAHQRWEEAGLVGRGDLAMDTAGHLAWA